MTRIIITLLISILSLLSNAQETKTELPTIKEGVTINVTVPKITSSKGKVYFALYNSEENFEEKIKFQEATGVIIDNKTEITFKNVPEGVYAITCYHDSNDNKKMDFYGFIPAEDYGVSNNPQSFGPPRFKTSKFEVENTD
ncbi:MAG: DUF2141 domain-containing protein, partial [Bacteroidota bacterium]